MATPLQYVVSLRNEQFIQGMKQVQSVAGSVNSGVSRAFIATGITLAGSFAAVKSALDLGGAFSDLQARTGESIADLVVLERAFKDAGLGGRDGLGQALDYIQRSLGGVNDEGQPTAAIFARLGLSIEQLKGMSAVEQLDAVAGALGRLPTQADKAAAAAQMFGRSGVRMLQLLRDPSAISRARSEVGVFSQFLDRNAASFDRVSDRIGHGKDNLQQFAAGAASEMLPTLDRLTEKLDKVDWTKLGAAAAGPVAALADQLARVVENAAKLVGGEDNFGKLLGTAAVVGTAGMVARPVVKVARFVEPAAQAVGRGVSGMWNSRLAAQYLPKAAMRGASAVAAPLALLAAGAEWWTDSGRANKRTAGQSDMVADMRKRAAGVGSKQDVAAMAAEISAAREKLLAVANDPMNFGFYSGDEARAALQFVSILDGLERNLGKTMEANRAAAAEAAKLDAERAKIAQRRAEFEAAGARVRAAIEASYGSKMDRRSGESDEAYDRRRLALAKERVAATAAELEQLRAAYNAGKLTLADAERAEALSKEKLRMQELQGQLEREQAARRDSAGPSDAAGSGLSFAGIAPQVLSDRLSRVGGFLGATAGDVGRRAANASERMEKHLAFIRGRMAAPGAREAVWS